MWPESHFTLIFLVFKITWFISTYFSVSQLNRVLLQTNRAMISKDKDTNIWTKSPQRRVSFQDFSLQSGGCCFQSLSPIWLFVTPWTAARRLPCLSLYPEACSKSCPLSHWCHPALCRPLLLPSIFPSIRVFSNESVLHIRWPKYWSFSFAISPSNKYSGLISYRIEWLDLLAVQGTLKSHLQHHSSKASVLWHSAFFMIQLLHPYMTTGKTMALTRWIFVSKIMSMLFNMLSRLWLFFQEASLFQFHGCSHHLHWFWKPRK